jgi:hypothetical protein
MRRVHSMLVPSKGYNAHGAPRWPRDLIQHKSLISLLKDSSKVRQRTLAPIPAGVHDQVKVPEITNPYQ